MQQAIRAALPRVLMWDPRHEYQLPGAKIYSSHQQLAVDFIAGRHGGPWIFRPSWNTDEARRQFDQVCRAAIALQLDPLQPLLTFAIEECSDVIRNPGNPPEHLRRIAVQSRHFGIRLIIAGQRPTFVDTTIRGSTTFIRCGRLGYAGDCRTMAEWLGVTPQEIQQLPDRAGFVLDRGQLSRF